MSAIHGANRRSIYVPDISCLVLIPRPRRLLNGRVLLVGWTVRDSVQRGSHADGYEGEVRANVIDMNTLGTLGTYQALKMTEIKVRACRLYKPAWLGLVYFISTPLCSAFARYRT